MLTTLLHESVHIEVVQTIPPPIGTVISLHVISPLGTQDELGSVVGPVMTWGVMVNVGVKVNVGVFVAVTV